LSRYGNIEHILSLPFEEGIEIIEKSQEKQQEELLWQRWLAIYPYMEIGKLKFMSFNDYKYKLVSKKFKTTNMTKEEIEEDILKIKALYEWRCK
jgi:hypothetical protein